MDDTTTPNQHLFNLTQAMDILAEEEKTLTDAYEEQLKELETEFDSDETDPNLDTSQEITSPDESTNLNPQSSLTQKNQTLPLQENTQLIQPDSPTEPSSPELSKLDDQFSTNLS